MNKLRRQQAGRDAAQADGLRLTQCHGLANSGDLDQGLKLAYLDMQARASVAA